MLIRQIIALIVLAAVGIPAPNASGATAGSRGSRPLNIVENGKSASLIIRSPRAGRFESQAAQDLQKYVALMTGVTLPLVTTQDAIEKALVSGRPLIMIGQAALEASASFRSKLSRMIKPKPYLRADGIGLSREGNRIFLAGADDESHYFAVAELLRAWGVRWFMPGEFGECVPQESRAVQRSVLWLTERGDFSLFRSGSV